MSISHTYESGVDEHVRAFEPCFVILVYGRLSGDDKSPRVASIYRCNDRAQLASLLNSISIDDPVGNSITSIEFRTLDGSGAIDLAINQGWIDLFDRFVGASCPYDLV